MLLSISKMNLLGLRHSNSDHNDMDVDDTNINLAKSMAIVILFLTSFTLGVLPIKLYTWFKWKKSAKDNMYVKMLLGFGGGVLLCTTFLHLLPEVAENFEDLNLTPGVEIHYAELLMCVGFFVMYFVEECVHVYLKKKQKEENIGVLTRSLSIRRGETENNEKAAQEQKTFPDYGATVGHSHADHSHMIINFSETTTVAVIRGLLVVLALAVHELFEGLAIGLENSTSHVWYMFGAVSAHKLVIGFCIGVELVSSGLKNVIIVTYIFIFAIVSPIGIGIGIILTNSGESPTTVVSVFLQGLASGTLLYVVFFEILQSDKKHGLKQYCAIFLGFVVMFGLTLID